MSLKPEFSAALRRVATARTSSFTQLVRLSGLDPAWDFRGADLRDINFGDDNLAGFNFSGADLSGANLSSAQGLESALLTGLISDEATQWPPSYRPAATDYIGGPSGKILITGGSGQLAYALARAGGDKTTLVGRPQFDFDRPESIVATLREHNPSIVVNAAAYTAVDAAETDQSAAYRANRDGPQLLAEYCESANIPLIHLSADYVYDGEKGLPYVESDAVGPLSVYGASKLAGEIAIRQTKAKAIILRTSWIYGPTGRNFVRTMLRIAETRAELRVVADQRGCPTAALDLANAILSIVDRIRASGWQHEYGQVFHIANEGDTTWYGLAVAVFEEAARYGMRVPSVGQVATAEYPTPARRPMQTVLDCSRLATVFGLRLPHWRVGLARTVREIFDAPSPLSI